MQILQPPDNASYGLVTIASTLRTGPDWPVFLLPLLQCIYKASLCWQLHSLLILSVADGFWECICAKALGQFIDLAVLFHVFVSSPLPDISSQVSLVLNGFWPCLPLSLLNQPAHGFSQALSCCPCPRDPHFHPTCGLHPGLPRDLLAPTLWLADLLWTGPSGTLWCLASPCQDCSSEQCFQPTFSTAQPGNLITKIPVITTKTHPLYAH